MRRTVHCSVKHTEASVWLKISPELRVVMVAATEDVVGCELTPWMHTRGGRKSRFFAVPTRAFRIFRRCWDNRGAGEWERLDGRLAFEDILVACGQGWWR